MSVGLGKGLHNARFDPIYFLTPFIFRHEPLISSFVIPKLLGRLHAHSNIEPKLKDKVNSILNYKPVKNPSSASTD